MKKLFFMIAIMLVAMSGRSSAQSTSVQTNESEIVFLMSEEPHCLLRFDFMSLAELAAASDTLIDEEDMRFMESYPYPDAGPDEPAFLILVPDDDDINVIMIQEDEDGHALSLSMLTNVGWLAYYEDEGDGEGSYPGCLDDFLSMFYYIHHMDEVSR